MRTESCTIDALEYQEQLEDYKPVIAKHISNAPSRIRQTSTIPCINLDAQVKFISFETTEYEKVCSYAYKNLSKDTFPYYYQMKFGDYSNKGLDLSKYQPDWIKDYEKNCNMSFEEALIHLLYYIYIFHNLLK